MDQKFAKTNIFKERIYDICEVIEPGCKWSVFEEKTEPENRPQNSQPNQGGLRQYVMNRFMVGERERRQEPRSSEINVSRIIDQLAEYEEPVVEEKKE